MKDLKSQFPIFQTHPGLVYLDSAATAQVPQRVVEVYDRFEHTMRANVHRGIYDLSENASQAFEEVRLKVKKLVNIGDNFDVVFTSGATGGLNQIAFGLTHNLTVGDEVLITEMEHHSNLVPWQEFCQRQGVKLKFLPVTDKGDLDMSSLEVLITAQTKVISWVHSGNVSGCINEVKSIVEIAKKVGAVTVLDVCQSIPHIRVDMQDLGVDFVAFSSHKMYGPMGVGAIVGRRSILETMKPLQYGGGMIVEVTKDKSYWQESPYKFEAGTPFVSGVVAFGEAIDFILEIGYDNINRHERELVEYATQKLEAMKGVKILGDLGIDQKVGVFSLIVEGIHPHDVAEILNTKKVCVRAGAHCAMPYLAAMGEVATTRASFGIYTDKSDVDRLIEGLKEVQKVFGK
jgi:cysteine desulfurase/selenocysteine lyase